MPEAVIVSTARSPIGRANKGSLKDMRPDDLTAQMVQAALDKVPALSTDDIDDLLLGCGLPGGESGNNMGRIVAVLLGLDNVPGATVTRYCSSSAADHADGVPRDPGRRGRRVHQRGRRDGLPVRQGQFRQLAGHAQPTVRGRGGPHGGYGRGWCSGPWQDPRVDGAVPDAYIAMGQTAENLALVKGVTRHDMDEFGVRSQNRAEQAIKEGFWAREITPVTLPDGRVAYTDDGPRAGVTYEKTAQLKPVFRPDGG